MTLNVLLVVLGVSSVSVGYSLDRTSHVARGAAAICWAAWRVVRSSSGKQANNQTGSNEGRDS